MSLDNPAYGGTLWVAAIKYITHTVHIPNLLIGQNEVQTSGKLHEASSMGSSVCYTSRPINKRIMNIF